MTIFLALGTTFSPQYTSNEVLAYAMEHKHNKALFAMRVNDYTHIGLVNDINVYRANERGSYFFVPIK